MISSAVVPEEAGLADQRARWRRGDQIAVETILRSQPQLRRFTEAVLDLIYNEVILREERGDTPAPEEYTRRFPELAPEIGAQFEVHREFISRPRTIPPIGGTEDSRVNGQARHRP